MKAHPLVAGCDEAGRGCLAGPVFAAAVVLPPKVTPHPLVRDSKMLRPRERMEAAVWIKSHALAWGVAHCDVEEIARHNILWASVEAMHKALTQLSLKPDLILVDGNHFSPWNDVPYQCIPGGDATQACISAASILAKVERDLYMDELHQTFPYYGWDRNKGYATAEHREAIRKYGITVHHRKLFIQKITLQNLFTSKKQFLQTCIPLFREV